jgi:hypothetical protein
MPILAFAPPPPAWSFAGGSVAIQVSRAAFVALQRLGTTADGTRRLDLDDLPAIEALARGQEFDAELELVVAAIRSHGRVTCRWV